MKNSAKVLVIALLVDKIGGQIMKDSGPDSFHPVHPTVPVIVAMLAVMLALLFVMLAYARVCHSDNPYRPNLFRQNVPAGFVFSGSRFSGIDKKAIESLPFFKFSRLKGKKEGLECAICITKFEDSEVLRLLPHCKHAFHMTCIDQWLERHSSCPLCRNRLDAKDIHSFAYSESWRFLHNPSDLSDDPNVELFIQREEEGYRGSSRLSIGSNFRIPDREKKDELLSLDSDCYNGDRKLLHKFKHKIVSNVVVKNRWSDVNSSDMLFLRSEMLHSLSSKRFLDSTSERFHQDFTKNEQMMKKQDMETIGSSYESRVGRINNADELVGTSSSLDPCSPDENSSRILNPTEKRSMSEITNFSRLEFGLKSRIRDSPCEERTRRLWLPIVRQTLQWFAGRDKQSGPMLHSSNV